MAPTSVSCLEPGGPEVLWRGDEVALTAYPDELPPLPDNPDPDKKDPVTLPNENEFHVISGETVEVTVWFGFLSP